MVDEYDDPPPMGISQEQWRDMLEQVRKRDIASKKRAETRRLNAEVARAARLALPPANVEEAWRRHAELCPYAPYSPDAKEWFRDNLLFEFDGTKWRREVTRQRSNSGKSWQVERIMFRATDGRTVVVRDDGPNRRNDPLRDWGLPD